MRIPESSSAADTVWCFTTAWKSKSRHERERDGGGEREREMERGGERGREKGRVIKRVCATVVGEATARLCPGKNAYVIRICEAML